MLPSLAEGIELPEEEESGSNDSPAGHSPHTLVERGMENRIDFDPEHKRNGARTGGATSPLVDSKEAKNTATANVTVLLTGALPPSNPASTAPAPRQTGLGEVEVSKKICGLLRKTHLYNNAQQYRKWKYFS